MKLFSLRFPLISPRPYRRPLGFTLIELLVVIAIIALLAAILFPVFGRARENARRSSCLSNIKQLGIGMMQYMNDYDEVYPMHANGGSSAVNLRWPQMMNPYVKSNQVYNCPSSTNLDYKGDWATAGHIGYGMNYYLNSYYYPDSTAKRLQMSAISRPSETVWIAEINGIPLPSPDTNPYSYQCYPPYYGAISPGPTNTLYGMGSETPERLATRHFEGTNVLWGDGHAKWMRRDALENDRVSGNEAANQAASKYWWGR